MSEISAMPSKIVEWLKENERLSYIKFLTEYPPVKKAVPLKHTTVAVGIESMEIVDSFTETDEGVLVENEFCRQAKIRIRLSIHAPYSSGGSACHEAFTDIIDCLTFASGMDILSSGCNEIFSDRDTDAFVLTAWVLVNASLCPAETSGLVFPSFLNKELLCGSHINDPSIHLSEKDRLFVDEPFVSGTYFGTGDSSRTINLGFKPNAVIVVGNQAPLIYSNHAAQKNIAYGAIAVRKGGSLGLDITENGFTVKSTENVTARSTHPMLNELGMSYCYAALR